MITILSLGIIAVGILAMHARSISRAVGIVWINLQVNVTIAYIAIEFAIRTFDRYVGLDSDIFYVSNMTLVILGLNVYLLCAYKITVGLARYREKYPLLSLAPIALTAIYLLVLNPINHIIYFSEVRGTVTVERVAYIVISSAVSI